MGVAPGTRFGPYEIGAPLGAGGMGEVYKARDTRLDRTVAIKILPPALTDPAFRERFAREARAISQLDHPHICALYDVGEHDGTAYLVMQYLEGETLAERLQKGPLSVAQALEYATQIADALARAHRAGIIHRDLKPSNVMLTKAGARLLDFGVAKAAPPVQVPVAHTATRTTPAELTTPGTILGTFQYMAPEVIEGMEADARSDIWAFGCVLYEMLTGARPFDGRSHAGLIANIISADLRPLRQLQPKVSGAIERLAGRCLSKDPDARWQSMLDVAQELRWAATGDESASRDAARSWRWLAIAYGAPALLAVAAVVAWQMAAATSRQTIAPSPAMLTFLPPAGLTLTPFASSGTPQFALSPDGRRIAFVASAAGRPPTLWVRPIESRVAQEVPGSDDASDPFWSPDSQSIGFIAEGKLKTIGLQGERPRILASIVDAAGATWHGDNILVGRNAGSLARVSITGGRVMDATALRPGAGGQRWPQFLPDGRHFIYTESRGSVMLASLDSSTSTELIDARATAVFDPQGFLLFVRDQQLLMAQPIDRASFKPIGSPREVLDPLRYAAGSGYPPVSVSKTGLLAYWDGTTVQTALGWFDRGGKALTAISVPRAPTGARGISTFAISPDDRQVAFTVVAERGDGPGIWLMGPTGDASRFSFAPAAGQRPIWSYDGAQVRYSSISAGRLTLSQRSVRDEKNRDLATIELREQVVPIQGSSYATAWSRDARTAVLSVAMPTTGWDVAAYSVETGQLTPLLATAAYEIQPRLSPDDRWIAYASNESGRWEVFVEPFPPSGARKQVSISGGSQPVWRRDGSELYFLAPDGKLMAVGVTPGATFAHSAPRALFETRIRPTYPPFPVNYDVTSDGQRFLIDSVQPNTGPSISIVVNWSAASRGDRK